ncbi:hypothetical protein B0F87_103285 [Methylobacter tundripaludum]|uniref:Uncharacterized protein n=1 Tax=Methylobacter tundripaludum TaxID=173365 RepID=A0A2S6HGS5_9GAMM|nr:hypothetical protein B0F87_103285 [Methylobacter tundripaludum]
MQEQLPRHEEHEVLFLRALRVFVVIGFYPFLSNTSYL